MRVLSLTQPWATLVVIGAKKFETRSWTTGYRGPLLIHAAKNFPKWAREFTTEPICYETVKLFPRHPQGLGYPTGAIVGQVELAYIFSTSDPGLFLTERERAFGDYSPGRFAWQLVNPKEFMEPIPAKGALGLWEYDGPK